MPSPEEAEGISLPSFQSWVRHLLCGREWLPFSGAQDARLPAGAKGGAYRRGRDQREAGYGSDSVPGM